MEAYMMLDSDAMPLSAASGDKLAWVLEARMSMARLAFFSLIMSGLSINAPIVSIMTSCDPSPTLAPLKALRASPTNV